MTTALADHELSMLAREAKRRGVRILIERVSGEHFATDERDPDYIFRVTSVSCTCHSFIRYQRCLHLAALCGEKGWPDDDDPDPPAGPAAPVAADAPVMPCPACDHGVETIRRAGGVEQRVRCQTCAGRGIVAIAELIARDNTADQGTDLDPAA